MKQREQARIQVLNTVLEHHLATGQAAEIMGISERHTKRLLAAYRKDGPAALAHGNRGRRPHNAVPEDAAAAVVKLASNGYAGANHSHFTELLREREGIDLSRPTVRRILVKTGIGSPRSRRSQQHRFRRKRMPQEGMLVQIDGSPHPWLEDRGPRFVLLLAVDDATGTVAQTIFHPTEDTRGYLVLLEGLIRAMGDPPGPVQRPPCGLQIQRPPGAGALRVHPVRPGDAGTGHPADLRPVSPGQGKSGADGVDIPGPAGHRAAPGRRYYHGRGQCRPAGISAPLQPRFAVAAEQPEQAYRPVPADLSLTETVSIRHTRKVARDNTVKYQWRVLQLLPGEERTSYAGLRVDVLERADGELMLRYQGEAVDFQEAAQPTAALWGEGTGLLPSADKPETASGLASSHLDEDQQKLLAALESSVEKRAKARKATGKGRAGKEKPVRHRLHRTPTPTQQARWEAVQQAQGRGLSLRAIARELGMAKNTVGKYLKADSPPTKLLSAKERAKAEALAEVQIAAD